MAESWKAAYGQVKMELEEYKGTIVPALTERVRELMKCLRYVARMAGFDIIGRIEFRDLKTGRKYR